MSIRGKNRGVNTESSGHTERLQRVSCIFDNTSLSYCQGDVSERLIFQLCMSDILFKILDIGLNNYILRRETYFNEEFTGYYESFVDSNPNFDVGSDAIQEDLERIYVYIEELNKKFCMIENVKTVLESVTRTTT